MAQDTISHFSHPGHELVKRHCVGPYCCDMCWENLTGPAYGCGAGCDFAIHDSCAGHPQALSSPAHHSHQLVLVQTRRDAALACDVCAGNCAPGAFLYRCPPCGFDMHPRCARLPQVVRSAHHPAHDLTLVVADGRCAACHLGAGHAWYYRCSACNADLHVSCATARPENNTGARPAGDVQAAEQEIQAALARARIEEMTRSAALDLWSPSCNKRRDHF